MSETSTLIACNEKITRAELANVPTPPATGTHVPIPHLAVVEGLVDTLSRRHIGVVGEEYAVSKDGMEMFGVIDLEASFDGCRFAIGIRNSRDKRGPALFSPQLVWTWTRPNLASLRPGLTQMGTVFLVLATGGVQ